MRRRRLLVGVALVVLAVAAVALIMVNPFAGSTRASDATGLDNGAATTTTTIVRRDLSEQTQVSATLGYADASVISVPAGTPPTSVQQAQQQATSAQAGVRSAAATLAADMQASTQATATRSADRRKLALDCAGDNAAQSASNGTGSGGVGGGMNGSGSTGNAATPCASDAQVAATDSQDVVQAQTKVAADRSALSSANTSLASAEQNLAAAQESASTVGQTSVYTMLPKIGTVVRRGQPLYAISGHPVLLLYGGVAPWRAFRDGMSSGADVAELNRNLGLRGDEFTSQTAAAVSALQAVHGLPATGELLLGAVVFEPGAVRVTSVTPGTGSTVQAGPVLGVTSLHRVVTIALDAGQQSSVKIGDPVVITLPDNSTTPGRISFVGTVASTPSGSSDQTGSGSSSPTIEVDVRPTDPAATGRLDQAPVDVLITTETVHQVLVVPVNALVALATGGYALEEVEPSGVHKLVAATTGLFDDADGLVQVTGAQLRAGQRVVVPSAS